MADALMTHGVGTVFGVPGESYLAVLDALVDTNIRFLSARQEGGAAFMAEAWGKLTGQPGVCMVSRAPGATNASIGVHAARYHSTPMLLIVGGIPTQDRGREAFQEINCRRFFEPIAKSVIEPTDPNKIASAMREAFKIAGSGRPGPVVVALPEDLLSASTDETDVEPVEIVRAVPTVNEIDTILDEIERAHRPVVLVGGGRWTTEARRHLSDFVVANRIAVVVGFRFHDLVDNHADSYCGEAGVAMPPAVRQTINEADLIVGLGVRFAQITTDSWSLIGVNEPHRRIVQIHPERAEIGRIVPVDVAVVTDPSVTIKELHRRSVGGIARRADWLAQRRQAFLDASAPPVGDGGLDMGAVMAVLSEHLDSNAIVCNGAGNFSVWPNKFLRYGSEARLLAPQSGAMGYGLPAAIAAKAAYPDRRVLCFTGDGDLQMTIQELGTARQHSCEPVIIVIDNSMYGTIRMHQERTYPTREYATAIINPDFAAVARAYGMHGERVQRTDEFAPALGRVLESSTGGLLHLVVDPTMLTPFESIAQVRARAGESRTQVLAPR